MTGGLHHPWRAFRRLRHWKLIWACLPGDKVAETDYAEKTVTMDPRPLQRERRCTIAHETEHIRRGPVPDWLWPREEQAIDRIVARRLLPNVRLIADAIAWADWNLDIAAEELWVDRATLESRLRNMTHPAERAYMRRRFGGEDR